MLSAIACPDCEGASGNRKCPLCKGKGRVEVRLAGSSGGWRGGGGSTSKFGNVLVQADNVTFDSKSEEQYYQHLKMLQQAGEIEGLRIHTRFNLTCPGLDGKPKVVATYEADFDYFDKAGKFHVIDVKGMRTQMFIMKRKWLKLQTGIEIEEVRA